MSEKENTSRVKDNFCKHLFWKKKGDKSPRACDCKSLDVQNNSASKRIFMTTDQYNKQKAIRKIKKWKNQPKKIQNAINSLKLPKESCWKCCDSHYKDLQAAERFKQRVKTNNDLYTRGWAINTTTPLPSKWDSKGKLNIYCNWDFFS